MMPVIQFPLETVQHVAQPGEPCTLQRFAGFLRAVAAATNEDDRSRGVVGARKFPYLAHEVRIDVPVGPVIPGDVQRADRMADEQILHLAATVDEQGVRTGMQECVRLAGFEVVHERPIVCRKRLTALAFVGTLSSQHRRAPRRSTNAERLVGADLMFSLRAPHRLPGGDKEMPLKRRAP